MSAIAILLIVLSYFGLLLSISHFTSKGADNQSFFLGNRKSPWYLVAFGMIGTSLSGVTFISVPGWVGTSQFSYLQMVLGYLLGYLVVGGVLMPLYYRLNLTSIYTYLEGRFGAKTYKTGAFYFILSRTIGAAFRLWLVANVLQPAIFTPLGIPFPITVALTILLIWVYTFKGGIKTIVWTDSLQTLFMLMAVGVTIWQIGESMDLSLSGIIKEIDNSQYSQIFFFDDWRDQKFFWKQFMSGAFITIVMTGLDQDMMQKNLSCKNIKEAQLNMFSLSTILVVVNVFFLSLGALLYLYANSEGVEIPSKTDDLFPILALGGKLGNGVVVLFILGLVAAAYSSADSALTALTTSVCIDLLNIKEQDSSQAKQKRKKVHVLMSFMLFLVIILFDLLNDESVISSLFKAAGYTYGPLLALYAYGLITKRQVKDQMIPLVCIIAPILTYIIQFNSEAWFNGYKFGFEVLILNGLLTFLGIQLFSYKSSMQSDRAR